MNNVVLYFLFSKKSQAPQVFNENVFTLFAATLVSAADNSQTDFKAETVCRLLTVLTAETMTSC